MTTAQDLDLRCSTLTAALGERPAGTAGSWHRILLVELPLPWPNAIEDHPRLADVAASAAEGRHHRILALASALTPDEATPDDGFRVICYWRPVDGPFARFSRAEICAPEEGVAEIVGHLIEADDATLAAIPANSFAAGSPTSEPIVRDLLVCTHGTRDRCCGKLGTDLFREMSSHVPRDVRLWRTSHTGGHRFAPTGVTFPDGGMWAGIDAALARGLIDRTIPASLAAEHARGSVGVPAGPAQAADAAGLARHGWPWWDGARDITVETEVDRCLVTITTSQQQHRAVIRPGREVPVPDCGNPLDQARKSMTEWDLVSFDEI